MVEGEGMHLQFVLIENRPSKRRTMSSEEGKPLLLRVGGDIIREDFLEVVA